MIGVIAAAALPAPKSVTPSATADDLLARARLLELWIWHNVASGCDGLVQDIAADIRRTGKFFS